MFEKTRSRKEQKAKQRSKKLKCTEENFVTDISHDI